MQVAPRCGYEQILEFLQENATPEAEIALAPNASGTVGVRGPGGIEGGSWFFYDECSADLARAAMKLNIPVHLSSKPLSLPSPGGNTPGVDIYDIVDDDTNVLYDPDVG